MILKNAFTNNQGKGIASDFDHQVKYMARLSNNAVGRNGNSWMVISLPYLWFSTQTVDGNPEEVVMNGEKGGRWLWESGIGYVSANGKRRQLTIQGSDYRVFAPDGQEWIFHGPSASGSLRGKLQSSTAANGIVRTVSFDGNDWQDSVVKTDPDTGDEVGLYYTYATSGSHEGKILSVEKRITRGGIVVPLKRWDYTYHDGNDTAGSLNDLKTGEVLVYQADSETWVSVGTSYYRYYTGNSSIGFTHGLRYEVAPDDYARLREAGLDPADVTAVPDATLGEYATAYYEYNSDHWITRSITQAGTLETNYSHLDSDQTGGRNWWRRTIETRPDGATVSTYFNQYNRPLLNVLSQGGDNWADYWEYDAQNRETLHANPSAIASFTEPGSASADFSVTLASNAGLIETKAYYPTSGGGAGSAPGYLQSESVQEGSSGTPVKQKELTYASRTVGGSTIYRVASETIYQSDSGGGSSPATTQYEYTWQSGTFVPHSKTVKPPVVLSGQNGTGVQYERVTVFDDLGNTRWEKDERGHIRFRSHDRLTGAPVTEIEDADTEKVSGAPSGWSTPSGGGLNLVTDFESDRFGRITRILGPERPALMDEDATEATIVRTTDFAVYRDDLRETWTARGYATGEPGSHGFATLGAVTILRVDADGNELEEIQAVRECACGALNAAESFPQSQWRRWTSYLMDAADRITETRAYFLIPESGEGQEGVHYNATRFGYDVMNRQNQVVSPGGTINRQVFDARGSVTSEWIGTNDTGATDSDPSGGSATGNNMVETISFEYDGGSDGGDGNLTRQSAKVDNHSANDRETQYRYDFRNRREEIETNDGTTAYFTVHTLDNVGRVTQEDRYHTSIAAANLTARRTASFDNRDRNYRDEIHSVDPSTGAVGNALVSQRWFDAAGNVIKSTQAGSEAITKRIHDGVNRVVASYLVYHTGSSSNDDDVSADTVIEQTEHSYDASGLPLLTTAYQRLDDATGTGALNGPNGSQPQARRSYVAKWFDGIGRQVAHADFGTNGGAALVRPDVAPERSDTVLVSSTRYADSGDGNAEIDPQGIETRWVNDALGRQIRLIENHVAGGEGLDENRITEMAYHADGGLARLTLRNAETGDQVTRWVYGTSLDDSGIASSQLVMAKIFPESDDRDTPLGDGSDGVFERIEYAYNRQGELIQRIDPNETAHAYGYDKLGRMVQDRVTAFGTGINDSVKRISVSFNHQGRTASVSSHNHATVGSGSILNQVAYEYDGFGNLTSDQQEHGGAVNGSTPEVSYGYADASSGNTARRTSMTYPDGRQLDFSYGAANSADDRLSRMASFKINGESGDLVTYTRAGASRYVKIAYPEPGVQLTYLKSANQPLGDAGDRYIGYDRFGRTVDMRWETISGGAVRDQFQWGYNRASNRQWRANLAAIAGDQDEFYSYDGLSQVVTGSRGTLNLNGTAIGSIPAAQELFYYDPTGNWLGYLLSEDGAVSIDQARTSNRDNQVTQFDGSSAGIAYDRAGNATLMAPDQSGDFATSYRLTWDAWNRLVEIQDEAGTTTIATYAYDGRFRRITKEVGGTTTHYYFSNDWKPVEEREGASSNASRQYVWGQRPGHRDELILRDRDTTGNGSLDERLYCLMDYYNATSIIDTAGDVQERYAYSAFGERRILAPDFSDRSSSSFDWDFGFQGQFLDDESGYCDYGFRYYLPALGQWINRDPIGENGGFNLYAFVTNNPVNLNDWYGLQGGKRDACCGGKKVKLGQRQTCCGGEVVTNGAGSRCCAGKTKYDPRKQCCVNGSPKDKIPRWERDGYNSDEECAALEAPDLKTGDGDAIPYIFENVVPAAGTMMDGVRLGSCRTLVCPKS